MNIEDTLAPKSDQLDAVELVGGPRTFTVAEVTRGNDEQPLQIKLAEFPRVWRPSKGMRRVLAFCWGKESDVWIGRRVTLFCDPTIKFGPETTGGTRISHLSHIDGPKKIPEILTRGKSKLFTVQPLPDEISWPDRIALATDRDDLNRLFEQAKAVRANDARFEKLLAARAAELGIGKAAPEPEPEPAADEPGDSLWAEPEPA